MVESGHWHFAVWNTWMGLDSTDRDEAGQHGGGVQRGPATSQDVRGPPEVLQPHWQGLLPLQRER